MGLLGKSINLTRCNIVAPPSGPDFEAARFHEIEPGSEVRERSGIVPFEIDTAYEIGAGRYAFRARIDRRTPDPTAVRERVRELVRTEMEETGAAFISAKQRKTLKALAEEELMVGLRPKSSLIECVIDGAVLHIGSTAKAHLGAIMALLRLAGAVVDLKAPWLDNPQGMDESSDIVVPKEPGQSVLGCRFLKALLSDSEVLIEPETGSVRLATREARVTLAEGVLNDLYRYVEEGAEILSAKLVLGAVPMRLDAFAYRISALKLPGLPATGHWTVRLDERLEQIAAVWGMFDAKYSAWAESVLEAAAT